MVRVGIVGGYAISGNVDTFITNVVDLLPEGFTIELLLHPDADGVTPDIARVDLELGASSRALTTILGLTKALTAYIMEHQPDLLFQVTKFPVHGFAATVAGHATDTPILTRYAGANFHEYRVEESRVRGVQSYLLNNGFGRIPARFSDGVIVLGPSGDEDVRRYGPPETVFEIPQPIDHDRFHPVSDEERSRIRNRLGIREQERTFLTVGRLSRRKGMDTIIDTAQQLRRANVEFEWYVIGDGPKRSDLESTPSVSPLGRIPHEVIPDYYRATDLYVQPSLIEGLPNVLLEAAACGQPSVARDVGDSTRVASATFRVDAMLPRLLQADHEPVALGPAFTPRVLSEAYADAIIRTASERRWSDH